MRIGLDIDGVLLDTMKAYIKIYNHNYDEKRKVSDITDFHFGYILGLEDKEMYEIFEEINIKRIDLVDNSIPTIIDKWKSKGYTVDLITATSSKTIIKKYQRLKYLGVNFDNVHRVDGLKGEYAELYDLIIDDSPDQLDDILLHGGRAICYDQPWNRKWEGERIYSFSQLGGL